MTLELQRDHVVAAATTTEVTVTGTTISMGHALQTKRGVGTSTDHLYESIREGSHRLGRAAWENHAQDEEFLTDVDDDDDTAMAYHQRRVSTNPSVTSTPRPAVARGFMVGSPGCYLWIKWRIGRVDCG